MVIFALRAQTATISYHYQEEITMVKLVVQ
jgi:hypothetical protein